MAFVPIYILILFFTIIVDYAAGILIEKSDGTRRKLFLVLSIIANVGILGFFKYYNFFAWNLNSLFSAPDAIPLLQIVLPIGLSFHTFQAMSYTIEVYRGNQKAERHFGIYALYVMFFPQLVAGPIERPQNMLHQFHEKKTFNYDNVASGLRLVLWGLFKKVVVADRIAILIDPVYNKPQAYSALTLVIVLVLFFYEIYCDFSGYSDIALGTARVLGFKLMVNFNFPYRSRSMTEFWRRWHISLSTWLNDYLFNPIITGLRFWGTWGVITALFITFFISGFWHGAGWHFIIFGLVHCAAVIYEYLTRKQRKKIFSKLPLAVNNFISRLITSAYLIMSMVFFRATSISDAFFILKKVPSSIGEVFNSIKNPSLLAGKYLSNISIFSVCVCFFWIIVLDLFQHFILKDDADVFIDRRPKVMRWSVYCVFSVCILLFGVFDNKQFIYFQF